MVYFTDFGSQNTVIYSCIGAGCLALLVLIGISVAFILRRRKNNPATQESIPLNKPKISGKNVSIKSLLQGDISTPEHYEFDKLEEYDMQRCNSSTNYQGRKHNKAGKLNLHPRKVVKISRPFYLCLLILEHFGQ